MKDYYWFAIRTHSTHTGMKIKLLSRRFERQEDAQQWSDYSKKEDKNSKKFTYKTMYMKCPSTEC